MQISKFDADTIRAIMTLAAGVLAFAGAVLTFVNNRIQATSTPEAKQRLFSNLIAAAEGVLWFSGLISSITFNSLAVGLWFFLFAFAVHSLNFLRGHGGRIRIEILMLVISMGFVVMMVCFYFISQILDILRRISG